MVFYHVYPRTITKPFAELTRTRLPIPMPRRLIIYMLLSYNRKDYCSLLLSALDLSYFIARCLVEQANAPDFLPRHGPFRPMFTHSLYPSNCDVRANCQFALLLPVTVALTP